MVWNYFQWHILGAPESLIWPNVASVCRVLLLVSGLVVVTALALGAQRATDRLSAFALVLLPPLLVVTVPQFGVDFVRFGPQEPVLVGGVMLGGSFLFLGCRDLVSGDASRRRTRVALLLLLGYPLWLLGLYQKESSVCVAVVVALVAFGNRHSLRRGFAALDRGKQVLLAAVGVAAALPLAHVAVEAVVIARGQSVLGAGESPTERARHVGTALRAMTSVLGTPIGSWLLLIVGAHVAVRLLQRKPDWTQIALLVGALVSLAWSTQIGLYPSRYYLPFLSLLAVAFSRLLSELRPSLRWVAIVVFLSALELREILFGTHLGWCILIGAAWGIGYGLIRHRSEWIFTALVVGVLASVAWSPEVGLFPSGYYQPGIAAAAIGVGLLLVRRPNLLMPASAVVAAGLVFLMAAPARTAVDDWVDSERTASSLVNLVARLHASGCPVVVTGLDVERAAALPVLVRLQKLPRVSCRATEAFVVSGPLRTELPSHRICAAGARESLGSWTLTGERVRVTRCKIAPAAMSFVLRNRMS